MGKENTVSWEECKLKQPEVTLVPQIVKTLKLWMCQALEQALGRGGGGGGGGEGSPLADHRGLLQIKYSYTLASQQS